MTIKKESTKPTKAAAKPVSTSAEAKPAKAAVKAPAKPKAAAKAKAPVVETKVAAAETRRAEPTAKNPSHDDISRLAVRYWAERGYHDGHADQDWQRAEHHLRNS